MSLPSLIALPAELHALLDHARQTFQSRLDEAGQGTLAAWPSARHAALARVLAASDFVAEQAARDPQMLVELAASGELERSLAAGELRGQLEQALADCTNEDDLARRLRRYRNRQQTRIIWRDVSRLADLAETCRDLSELADASIDLAYHWLYALLCAQSGTPIGGRSGEPQHLVVLGMGKLGAFELNLSSDIDLIFAYPEGGQTVGARRSLDNQEFFTRLGQRLIKALDAMTVDGFVFRVDMRLRPYGDSGPLASNFDALERYFITQGREWERYAWLKARLLNRPADAELEAIVRPFVFRKYLDYATLGAMRALHAEVRRDVARRELAEHVKLGPGGIREIEFIAQAQQLIRGGRDAELRVRPTLEALAVLGGKSLLPASAVLELSAAYLFLRRLEHRLQYLDDAQRHDLPEDEEDRGRIARMSGFASWKTFYEALQSHRQAVSRHFNSAFAERGAAPEAWPEHSRLAALRASQRYATLPDASRQRLDRLVPALARAAKGTADPEATLTRGVDFVEAIASRAAYLALLAEHPEALERVMRMIGASSWAAEFITRHPLLLDELLDDRVLYAPPDFAAFAGTLRKQLAEAQDDTERRMNLLREAHQAQVFRLLAQDLAGLLTVEKLADHLSALADLMLQVTLDQVWRDLRNRHRDAPRFSVVAYGKLGGKELGYASDLDIIFLYDDEHERAPEIYARLAQRLNAWLSSRTSSGMLFETDLELRPSGASGLLVSSIEAFARYQEESAWLWEHQALTRARHCAGDPQVGAAFEKIRERILRRERDPLATEKEILSMRDKLLAAHPNTSGLFDLKHDRGGMIDIEFAVQCLVLSHSHRFAELTGNLGNIALLKMSAERGLIPPDLAERCRDAYREYRRLQHRLRLNGARYARVPREQVQAEAEAVRALWQAVFSAT